MISARSQSLEIKNQLFQIKSDIEVCSRNLMILLNSNDMLLPADTLLTRTGKAVQEGIQTIEQNPLMGYAVEQVSAATLNKNLEGSRMLPEFSVGYFSQTIMGTQEVNGEPRDFGSDFRFTGVQAGISVPIWFKPYSARIKAARISEIKAKTDAENYSRLLSGNYTSLIQEFKKYSSTVDFYENQAVPEADLIIEQATLSYKSGGLDYLDYVLTLNRALAIRQNYLDALNSYVQTNISIENLTGKIF